MSERQEKTARLIREAAAEYVARESNYTSLITITHVHVSSDLKEARIFFTAYPDDKEEVVLAFLKRHERDFKTVLKQRAKLVRLPAVHFALDRGEKNRQRLDEIVQEET